MIIPGEFPCNKVQVAILYAEVQMHVCVLCWSVHAADQLASQQTNLLSELP